MSEKESTHMEFGANRPSKHNQRKRALLWRMYDAQLATRKHLAALALKRRTAHLNLNNKPFGDK